MDMPANHLPALWDLQRKAMWMLQRSTTSGPWTNRNSPGAQKCTVTGNWPWISTQKTLSLPWCHEWGLKFLTCKHTACWGKKKWRDGEKLSPQRIYVVIFNSSSLQSTQMKGQTGRSHMKSWLGLRETSSSIKQQGLSPSLRGWNWWLDGLTRSLSKQRIMLLQQREGNL